MKWEYLVLEKHGRGWQINKVRQEGLTGKNHQDVLNLMGQEGWEQVVLLRIRDELSFYLKRPPELSFYFKRPLA